MVIGPGVDVTWRPVGDSDREALRHLAARCLASDGGWPGFAEQAYVDRAFLAPGTATLAALDADGRMVAAGALVVRRDKAHAFGLVDPAARGRGLGRHLLAWTLATAGTTSVQIGTESVTPAAERLYAKHGFERVFAEDVMLRDLAVPLPAAPLPTGIEVETWSGDAKGDFYQAYRTAFLDRPGFPDWTREQWVEWTAGDEEFSPDLSLLARAGDVPAGFITSTPSWIVQVGVRPDWRRRGLAAALVVAVLQAMRERGGSSCGLDVNVDNPAAAGLYRRLGFAVIGRRARYEQVTPRSRTTSG